MAGRLSNQLRCVTNATAIRKHATSARVTLAYDKHEAVKPSSSKPAPTAVIFMHGLFGSKKNNRSISKALARDLGRPVFAVDLRNHGDSPHHVEHDYVAMADDMAGFIAQHDLGESTLIGHSMGAKTAMALALKSPDIVKDIVVVDNAPVDAMLQSQFTKYIQGMRKIEDARVSRLAEADQILQTYEESLPIRQFLLGNLTRQSSHKTLKFQIPLDILSHSLAKLGDFPYKNPLEARFIKPALFVRGTRSHYVPDDVLPLIGRFFPRFELVDVCAGHWLISEQPDAFRRAVVEFLTPKE